MTYIVAYLSDSAQCLECYKLTPIERDQLLTIGHTPRYSTPDAAVHITSVNENENQLIFFTICRSGVTLVV